VTLYAKIYNMLLRYFYDEKLAQASYLVGCLENGEALIIDPARDTRPYLEAAAAEGLTIAHVTETHIHADFVSGSRKLAHQTGARLYLSDMGGAGWTYTFADERITLLHDGDSFMVGNIRIEVLHTPGHTPEHLCFRLTDTLAADAPLGIFTGDFLFVGDVGRPDLLEEVAKVQDTREPGARQQFRNVQQFKQMPDYLQIYPGHGAGSACGKAIGSLPTTTLGYEKLFNPAFQFDDEDQFVEWLLADQPEAPRYFAQMKIVNRDAQPLTDSDDIRVLPPDAIDAVLEKGYLIIDARPLDDFARGHIPGTLGIPPTRKFNTYAGWFVNFTQPVYLIVDEASLAKRVEELRAIGVEDIAGVFLPDVVTQYAKRLMLTRISPAEAHQAALQNGVQIVDVRGQHEYESGHIEDALNIPLGYLPAHLDELPRDMLIVLQCETGVRSQIAASLLEKSGFHNVASLSGGLESWQASGLPISNLQD
jgi:hydroxyacylglutathione hydrolase